MDLLEFGVPKRTVTALNKKGIFTTDDVLNYVPRKYSDYSKITPLEEAAGKICAIKLHFNESKIEGEYGKDRRYTAYLLNEESGQSVKCTWWGNTYVSKFYKAYEGQNVIVGGKVVFDKDYGYQMTAPELFELECNFEPKVISVYRKIAGVSESTLKGLIYNLIKKVKEPLEDDVIKELGVCSYKDALYKVHFPKNIDDIREGSLRLLANQLLFFAMELKANECKAEAGPAFLSFKKTVEFGNSLPFPLTEDQKAVLNKILLNAKKGVRNNLLVQGDVGCGKTVIAIASMVNAAENGFQSALIAPTQVLASQHFSEICERVGSKEAVFLFAGQKASERKVLLKKIASGEAKYIIGTHSVFNKDVEFKNLGIIITDEEHRFGVRQKEALQKKAEAGVHIISMSATPIPRSLAAVYFGESKEILQIKSMPNGRKEIITRRQLYHDNTFKLIDKEVSLGHQAYVVCPAIGKDLDMDDYTEDEEMKTVLKAKANYEAHFSGSGYTIGMLHGKMKKDEIAETIRAFSSGEIQILISTTVIEVGVNVPNATVMVIEEAERFGLATLHQLRGRVGRSSLQSFCILISEDAKDNERLIAMENHASGFEIAEIDLKLRGTGNLIGTKQSGTDKNIVAILENGEFYEKIKSVADICLKKNLATGLKEIYEEAA